MKKRKAWKYLFSQFKFGTFLKPNHGILGNRAYILPTSLPMSQFKVMDKRSRYSLWPYANYEFFKRLDFIHDRAKGCWEQANKQVFPHDWGRSCFITDLHWVATSEQDGLTQSLFISSFIFVYFHELAEGQVVHNNNTCCAALTQFTIPRESRLCLVKR
jgi:hypothetical protein